MFQAWSKTITRFTNSIDPNSMQTRLTAGVLLAALAGIGGMAAWMGWRMQQICWIAIVSERPWWRPGSKKTCAPTAP
jgi:hypothetical protein